MFAYVGYDDYVNLSQLPIDVIGFVKYFTCYRISGDFIVFISFFIIAEWFEFAWQLIWAILCCNHSKDFRDNFGTFHGIFVIFPEKFHQIMTHFCCCCCFCSFNTYLKHKHVFQRKLIPYDIVLLTFYS